MLNKKASIQSSQLWQDMQSLNSIFLFNFI